MYWEDTMVLKVIMLVVFFAIMLGVGFYSRKHTKDVDLFLAAEALAHGSRHLPMEHLIFRRSYSSDMLDSLDGSMELHLHG